MTIAFVYSAIKLHLHVMPLLNGLLVAASRSSPAFDNLFKLKQLLPVFSRQLQKMMPRCPDVIKKKTRTGQARAHYQRHGSNLPTSYQSAA